MSVHLNQLACELNISIASLHEVLKSLNIEGCAMNHNQIIQDCVVSVLRAYSVSDLFLLKLLIGRKKNDIGSTIKDNFPLKVVGKIDLSMFDKRYKLPDCQEMNSAKIDIDSAFSYFKMSPNYDDKHPSFWMEELFFVTPSGEIESIKVSEFSNKDKQPFFSVLIGPNGVGKSSLMTLIVDFFIECYACIEDYNHVSVNFKGKMLGIRYHIDGQSTFLIRTDKICLAMVNNHLCALKYLRLPLIVACHLGAFDKFHYQSVDGSRQTKYDVPYYKYVGAHVNGNLISSSSIAFRLLFTLSEQIFENQRKNICSILDFIEYDHTISLEYSFVMKSKKSNTAHEIIRQYVLSNREYISLSSSEKKEKISQLYDFYYKRTVLGERQHMYDINFDAELISNSLKTAELQCIYKLKQCGLISKSKIIFKKKGQMIEADQMSSGEFAILATVLSISAAANVLHTLVLLDEPEISQHPNWQMSLIENLDNVLANRVCHLLIATHSHMIVSDLPMNRSSVIQLEKNDDGGISSQILESSTYGWSAEEVLLKVFKTSTDRNRYLGERIADLLEKMGNNSIRPKDVDKELRELSMISKHLSDVDPLKLVLNTIVEEYNK